MPSGFQLDTEAWLKSYEQAQGLAQEVLQLIQERNLRYPNGGAEASRLTANARRKVGTLGTEMEKLLQWLDAPESIYLSDVEKFRRRDLVHALKNKREQMLTALKRVPVSAGRTALMEGSTPEHFIPKETEHTAGLDTRGLLNLQEQVIRQQDEELEDMEKSITNTKHIALTIGEEVTLHTRLLEELDEDVDSTQSRLKAASKRVKHILKHSSNWKGGLIIFLLVVTLVVVVVVGLKLARLFA